MGDDIRFYARLYTSHKRLKARGSQDKDYNPDIIVGSWTEGRTPHLGNGTKRRLGPGLFKSEVNPSARNRGDSKPMVPVVRA